VWHALPSEEALALIGSDGGTGLSIISLLLAAIGVRLIHQGVINLSGAR